MAKNAVNPAASGPGGAHFEAQVGAYYLLSMLADMAPRGLPGTKIRSIDLQARAKGYYLDDVVIHAEDETGTPATLEIQIKRKVTFAPGDDVFAEVMAQIAAASKKPEFRTSRYELAIAIARTSRAIDGAYQDVLTWARQIDTPVSFIDRLRLPGVANEEMRSFISTFRQHLSNNDVDSSDESIWFLLRRLHILVFDFTAQESASEQLALERASRILHVDEAGRARALWSSLIDISLEIAVSGGSRKRSDGQLRQELNAAGFKLEDWRGARGAFRALREASMHALQDISVHIDDVTILRSHLISLVHQGLETGRYLEILGDGGVGKSGVLRHFIETSLSDSNVVVLRPGRVIPRGWTNMKATLGYQGTAREFISEIACDGGATIFVDGLDFLDDDERKTVVDLVREAAQVAGTQVIVTARSGFDRDEENWLPSTSISLLGRAKPITVDVLNENEMAELRRLAPNLSGLLNEANPAQEIARNPFRLSRLVAWRKDGSGIRTEVDMAEQWWSSADGVHGDELHRARKRILKKLAEASVAGERTVDLSDQPEAAIDALIRAGTLREYSTDRVRFTHDILREWAIHSLLLEEPALINDLKFGMVAPPGMARAIELISRKFLERDLDGSRWASLLNDLEVADAHGGWRRGVLLAPVRSEIGAQLLPKIASILLANNGKLIQEIARTLRATDVRPLQEAYAALTEHLPQLPSSLNVPYGPSWYRLLSWIVALEDSLPPHLVPDIVDVCCLWWSATFGFDPFTPSLLSMFYRWLSEIEEFERRDYSRAPSALIASLDHDRVGPLVTLIRTAFLAYGDKAPDLIHKYLQAQKVRRPDDVLGTVIKMPGRAPQVAPKELAALAAWALFPKTEIRGRHADLLGPFQHADDEFMPESPNHGPFLALLLSDKESGLALINNVIEHAISFRSNGKAAGENRIDIVLPTGTRSFPWRQTYNWSRQASGANSACVTSALMALEAWGHIRIERGDDIGLVIADIVKLENCYCAHLLVIADILLSHGQRAMEAAVPFLGSPELLTIDRERAAMDRFDTSSIDFFGLGGLLNRKEPAGHLNAEKLKNMPSRSKGLDEMLGNYIFSAQSELQKVLQTLLQSAQQRLGNFGGDADLGDPGFMVVHALNLIDPKNWVEREVAFDGRVVAARAYVSPPSEEAHLERLQGESKDDRRDQYFIAKLLNVVDNPGAGTSAFSKEAVTWARAAEIIAVSDKDDRERREQAFVSAAVVLLRDGDVADIEDNIGWALGKVKGALSTIDDGGPRMRPGLRFNNAGASFAGLVYALRYSATTGDIETLLAAAAAGSAALARGLISSCEALIAHDSRLLRAMIRCALRGCIKPRKRDGSSVSPGPSSVPQELAWLAGEGIEPSIPDLPVRSVRKRRTISLGLTEEVTESIRLSNPSEFIFDEQCAALWISCLSKMESKTEQAWSQKLVAALMQWSLEANGLNLGDVENQPSQWNEEFFRLAAYACANSTTAQIDQEILLPMCRLPARGFYGVVPKFLFAFDDLYFNRKEVGIAEAVHVRKKLSDHLVRSNGWRRISSDRSSRIESEIGPAIAAFFMNSFDPFGGAKTYILSAGLQNIDPLVPILEDLNRGGPSYFLATITLNLLEVTPRIELLQLAISAMGAWAAHFGSDVDFWADSGFGERVCKVLTDQLDLDRRAFESTSEARSKIDRLLTTMVSAGVAAAHRLERKIAFL